MGDINFWGIVNSNVTLCLEKGGNIIPLTNLNPGDRVWTLKKKTQKRRINL